jgi:hypothetical protein
MEIGIREKRRGDPPLHEPDAQGWGTPLEPRPPAGREAFFRECSAETGRMNEIKAGNERENCLTLA